MHMTRKAHSPTTTMMTDQIAARTRRPHDRPRVLLLNLEQVLTTRTSSVQAMHQTATMPTTIDGAAAGRRC